MCLVRESSIMSISRPVFRAGARRLVTVKSLKNVNHSKTSLLSSHTTNHLVQMQNPLNGGGLSTKSRNMSTNTHTPPPQFLPHSPSPSASHSHVKHQPSPAHLPRKPIIPSVVECFGYNSTLYPICGAMVASSYLASN